MGGSSSFVELNSTKIVPTGTQGDQAGLNLATPEGRVRHMSKEES